MDSADSITPKKIFPDVLVGPGFEKWIFCKSSFHTWIFLKKFTVHLSSLCKKDIFQRPQGQIKCLGKFDVRLYYFILQTKWRKIVFLTSEDCHRVKNVFIYPKMIYLKWKNYQKWGLVVLIKKNINWIWYKKIREQKVHLLYFRYLNALEKYF